MDVLIRKATILDPDSTYHGQQMDILVEKGIISTISKNITTKASRVIDGEQLHVSIGWMDIGAQIGDPGYEHREDIASAARAATAGGYTALAPYPNTNPVVHTKSGVLYLKQNTKDQLVEFFPVGALSHNCEGVDITEMIDMNQAGAVAFSDGKKPVQDSGLMMRALLYIKAFKGIVINQSLDKTIAPGGQANEGIISTSLGIGGIPNMAEEIMLQRDIYLAEYTNSKLHVANVSTAGGVDMIRRAKKKGLQITASVAVLNLAHTDEAIQTFDSYYKVMPPLRGKHDLKALKAGLKDGTIDLINSNHVPLEEEAKKLEFAYAKFGAIALETTFALANMHLNGILSMEQLIEKLAYNPRKLLHLTMPCIAVGEVANLTVFDPSQEWTVDEKSIRSKSKNDPFIGHTLKGKVRAVFNKKRVEIFV